MKRNLWRHLIALVLLAAAAWSFAVPPALAAPVAFTVSTVDDCTWTCLGAKIAALPGIIVLKLVNSVVGIVAYLLLQLFRLTDSIYLWLWDVVVNSVPPGDVGVWQKLWGQIWWFSMGFMIIVLTIQAGRILTAGDQAANGNGYGGRKRWLSWLISPIIAVVLSRMSLFIVGTVVRIQNVVWRGMLASGLESITVAKPARFTGTWQSAADMIKKIATGDIVNWDNFTVLMHVMLPQAALDPLDMLNQDLTGKGAHLAMALIVTVLALIITIFVIGLIYASKFVLIMLMLVGPIYFTLSAAKRDPTPGIGWLGIVVQTAAVQTWAGVLLRLLLVTVELADPNTVTSDFGKIGLTHLGLYAVGLGLLIWFWLLPMVNAVAKIGTLNGGAVIAAAGAFTGGVGSLMAAGGAKFGSEKIVRAGSNVQKAGAGVKQQGDNLKAAGEKFDAGGWQAPGGWIAGDQTVDGYLQKRQADAKRETEKKDGKNGKTSRDKEKEAGANASGTANGPSLLDKASRRVGSYGDTAIKNLGQQDTQRKEAAEQAAAQAEQTRLNVEPAEKKAAVEGKKQEIRKRIEANRAFQKTKQERHAEQAADAQRYDEHWTPFPMLLEQPDWKQQREEGEGIAQERQKRSEKERLEREAVDRASTTRKLLAAKLKMMPADEAKEFKAKLSGSNPEERAQMTDGVYTDWMQHQADAEMQKRAAVEDAAVDQQADRKRFAESLKGLSDSEKAARKAEYAAQVKLEHGPTIGTDTMSPTTPSNQPKTDKTPVAPKTKKSNRKGQSALPVG